MMPEELRVLTVQQPYASAIVAGLKDVENRSRRFPLADGTTIAIHAGMQTDPARLIAGAPDDLPHGYIIGLVRVAGSHDSSVDPSDVVDRCLSPWARSGHWHWMLEGAFPLPVPIKVRGQLALFRPSIEITRAVLAQL